MAESEEELKSLLMKVKESVWYHYFMANRWEDSGNSVRLYFGGLQKSLRMVIAAMNLKDAFSLEGSYNQPG